MHTSKFLLCQSWKDTGCTIDTWVNYLYKNKKRVFQNEYFLSQTEVAQFSKMHYN